MINRFAIAAALAAATATPAAAETIDFTGLGIGFVSSPYTVGSATFAGDEGSLFIGVVDFSGSERICSVDASSTCAAGLGVSFASPVSNLSFVVGGIDDLGSTLTALVTFGGGGSQSFSFTDFTDDQFTLIDFGNLGDITDVALSSTDVFGVAYDDFTFDIDAGVPEPATWAMMISGVAAAGGSARRRRSATALFA